MNRSEIIQTFYDSMVNAYEIDGDIHSNSSLRLFMDSGYSLNTVFKGNALSNNSRHYIREAITQFILNKPAIACQLLAKLNADALVEERSRFAHINMSDCVYLSDYYSKNSYEIKINNQIYALYIRKSLIARKMTKLMNFALPDVGYRGNAHYLFYQLNVIELLNSARLAGMNVTCNIGKFQINPQVLILVASRMYDKGIKPDDPYSDMKLNQIVIERNLRNVEAIDPCWPAGLR